MSANPFQYSNDGFLVAGEQIKLASDLSPFSDVLVASIGVNRHFITLQQLGRRGEVMHVDRRDGVLPIVQIPAITAAGMDGSNGMRFSGAGQSRQG